MVNAIEKSNQIKSNMHLMFMLIWKGCMFDFSVLWVNYIVVIFIYFVRMVNWKAEHFTMSLLFHTKLAAITSKSWRRRFAGALVYVNKTITTSGWVYDLLDHFNWDDHSPKVVLPSPHPISVPYIKAQHNA